MPQNLVIIYVYQHEAHPKRQTFGTTKHPCQCNNFEVSSFFWLPTSKWTIDPGAIFTTTFPANSSRLRVPLVMAASVQWSPLTNGPSQASPTKTHQGRGHMTRLSHWVKEKSFDRFWRIFADSKTSRRLDWEGEFTNITRATSPCHHCMVVELWS